jgi:geranylgeranyl pyrophosphate synthase
MAFQIVDDVIDFTGEQATVGKPVASDLRHGLITLPALIYMEMHPNDADMKALLNGDRYNEERVERAIESIRSSGAIDRSMDEARRFIEKAVKTIAGFQAGIERQSLEELAYYIVERSK